MKVRATAQLFFLVLLAVASTATARGNWNLALPDTAMVSSGVVYLEDLATGPVPTGARELVIRAGLEPGTVVEVSRQDVLRRLVTAGLASGVRMTGAPVTRIIVAGLEISMTELEEEVRDCIRKLVPAAREGAPVSWFDLELPDVELAAEGFWKVRLDRNTALEPGRNQVRVVVADEGNEKAVTVGVNFHQYGEVAVLRHDLDRNAALEPGSFDWEWRDLAESSRSLAVGRESLTGNSAARDLKAGRLLRQADLKESPVILAGETVDLKIQRGQVCVTVRAVARQDGCLGQNIPVKNELTGRLVNARVAGPGFVEWRK